jgi:hypothetical protein
MNLKTHIDAMRYILNAGAPSASDRWTDAFIGHMLTVGRDQIIEERIEKKKPIPEDMFTTICIEFALAPFSECNCDNELSCNILKSILPLPAVFDTKKISVLNFNGETIDTYGVDENNYRKLYSLRNKASGNSALSTPTTSWYYHNGYIFVQGNPLIKKLLVKSLFSKPDNIEVCSNGTNCTLSEKKGLFISGKWANRLYKITQSMILGLRQDKLNDQLDATKQTELK